MTETERDIEALVTHPETTMGAKYHDAGSCWGLINALIAEVRHLRAENERLKNALGTLLPMGVTLSDYEQILQAQKREMPAEKRPATVPRQPACTCNPMEMPFRSGSGHAPECPVHAAYLTKRESPSR